MRNENASSGLLLMGHRWYDHTLGRFLTRDPIGFAGGLNLYAYANSNPAGLVDPFGLQGVCANGVKFEPGDIVLRGVGTSNAASGFTYTHAGIVGPDGSTIYHVMGKGVTTDSATSFWNGADTYTGGSDSAETKRG